MKTDLFIVIKVRKWAINTMFTSFSYFLLLCDLFMIWEHQYNIRTGQYGIIAAPPRKSSATDPWGNNDSYILTFAVYGISTGIEYQAINCKCEVATRCLFWRSPNLSLVKSTNVRTHGVCKFIWLILSLSKISFDWSTALP